MSLSVALVIKNDYSIDRGFTQVAFAVSGLDSVCRLSILARMAQMRVLVTGGAGFIGSNIAKALARRGYRIVAADSFLSA